MRNFLTIAGFEFRTRLRRVSTWVYFLVFFALAMLWAAAAGGLIPGAIVAFGSGKVYINSPFALSVTVAFLGMAGLTVIAAVMGRAVQQDFEARAEHFFFTAPISKWQYLGGRFTGAAAVLLVILSSIALGNIAGLLLPGMDPDRVGPFRPAAYLVPYLTLVIPNILVLGGVFFVVAALTRRMLPVYIGSILCIVGFLAAQGLLRDMDNKTFAALLDPFGVVAQSRVVEYWSISERNTRIMSFEGALLWNRLLWLGIGAAIMALCFARFRFEHPGVSGARNKDAKSFAGADGPVGSTAPRVAQKQIGGLRLLPRLTWLYFRETVKSVYFVAIVFAGVLFMITTATTSGDLYGTTTWPVTYQMLELLSGTFSLFMLVIITLYAGELVWRERDNRLDQIQDALPVPTWLPLAAKLAALMLVPVILQAVLLLCGVGIQTAKGYHNYELPLYLRDLFGIRIIDYWLVCVLAIAVHALVNQKYVGHFIMIVYFLLVSFAPLLGFEHKLYLFATPAEYTYSDMNGFGHFLVRVRTFQGYYAAIAMLLAVFAYLFWVRGTTTDLRGRIAVARARFTAPVAGVTAVTALAAAGLGGYIFYNTNVQNPYVTASDGEKRQADYEKQYKALATAPQPKITGVSVAVDLFPGEQRVRMHGTYALANKSGVPIDRVHLGFANAPTLVVNKLEFGSPAKLVHNDMRIGVRSYEFATPLAPGATTELAFDFELPTHGFRNSGSNTEVVANGSFVNGFDVLPRIGYQPQGELVSDRDRKKFGLAPKERMLDREDPKGLAETYVANDADWITFDTVVSTDADQIAIAPGYLQREWTVNGRRYFAFRMDVPILNSFAFQSARYAVRKDQWGSVPIEIYYQPGHEYNLDRMVAGVKDSLAYFSTNFGPYQHKQFRIIEFPRYATFAQAFPNTIPYSESIGFIARVREGDEKDIDYPYYVTAHEAAHQWWAHQVIGGNVQGGTMLSETFAQYSALMVMKHKYGDAKMKRFLAYELDRYLLGRATEQKKELPLARVENQPYIHYRKGSLVMYALQDYIGEDNVNRALRAFRDEVAFKGPPYPNTTQFLKHLRAVTPAHLQYLIDDLFESITLYDNRAVAATAKALADGRYEVTLNILAKKLKADELGKEVNVPIDDWLEIGVLDDKDQPLLLEKRRIDREESEITVVVSGKPARAGIDPFNKLIDRKPKDNTVAVSIDSK